MKFDFHQTFHATSFSISFVLMCEQQGCTRLAAHFDIIICPRFLISGIWVCTTQHVAFVWSRSSTPSNKVEFNNFEWCCIRLARALIPVLGIQLINWVWTRFLSTWKLIQVTVLRPRCHNVAYFFEIVLHQTKIFVNIFAYQGAQMFHKVSRFNSFPRIMMKTLVQELL